jgi:cob(I)alamin adenosyltransferase
VSKFQRSKISEEELAVVNERALADKTLNIGAEDVKWCRKFVAKYEAKAKKHEAKALRCTSQQYGAYRSNAAQARKARDAMDANLEFQLEWLRRHRPDVYNEVK